MVKAFGNPFSPDEGDWDEMSRHFLEKPMTGNLNDICPPSLVTLRCLVRDSRLYFVMSEATTPAKIDSQEYQIMN